MKNTLIINLFAGPGAGKSTGAAYIFSKLKMAGIDAELVTEFAKDKVWEENPSPFKCQFYITGKQAFRISRVYGKVDVIVTDSPIILGAQYADSEGLKQACVDEFNKYATNTNFFINRVKKYNPNGRFQTEEDAKKIDVEFKQFLADNNISYTEIDGNEEGYNRIADYIKNILEVE